MKIIVFVLALAGYFVYYSCTFSAWIMWKHGSRASDRVRSIFYETWPFYWPAVVAFTAADWVEKGSLAYLLNWLHYLWWLCYWIVWRWMKDLDDDDDRWKRRRKKLAKAVKRVGDRLVVVTPLPARS